MKILSVGAPIQHEFVRGLAAHGWSKSKIGEVASLAGRGNVQGDFCPSKSGGRVPEIVGRLSDDDLSTKKRAGNLRL